MVTRSRVLQIILTVFGLTCLLGTSPRTIFATQPETNYNVDIYTQMLTGYMADQDLEVLPHGDLGAPEPTIVLNEAELGGSACITTDPNACKAVAKIQYPLQNNAVKDVPVSGSCQKTYPDDDSSTVGTCNFQKPINYKPNFLGSDSSGIDNLPVPGWQSYNHLFSASQCSGTTNNLAYGAHDLLLPGNIQAKLKLSLLWRAYATSITYQSKGNIDKEMPIGGINWLEELQIDGSTINLLDLYKSKLPDEMKPPSYKHIWETESDDSRGDLPPVPSYLRKSTWFAQWYYLYQQDKLAGEDWIKYFDCTPLYPNNTSAPGLAIGSVVVPLGPLNIPFNKGTIVDNLASRQGTEGRIIDATFMNPSGNGDKILSEMGKSIPFISHYFTQSFTEPKYLPTQLVYGANKASGKTITKYTPLVAMQFGQILDYPNIYYNNVLPPPRMPKYSEENIDIQDASAISTESKPSIFAIATDAVLSFLDIKVRTGMVGDFWSQAERYLEKPSYEILTASTELAKNTYLTNSAVNAVGTEGGEFFPLNDRTSNTIKYNFSTFLACKGPDRKDYANTPSMVALGTATNTCGLPSSGSSGSICSSTPTAAEISDAANRVGSKYGIPGKWLEGMFMYEGATAKMGSACVEETDYKVMGPLQISASAYKLATCDNERFPSASAEKSQCSDVTKISRCSLEGSLELAARTLLQKLNAYGYYSGSYDCNATKANVSTSELYRATNAYSGCGIMKGKPYAQWICEYARNCPSPLPPIGAPKTCAGN
ncbi:MAG: hypothetical protein WAV40_03075 [Microgenomates group bacterium]